MARFRIFLGSRGPSTSATVGTAAGTGAASAAGASVVFLHPSGDTSLGGWTDQSAGTSNIYQSIDEETINDSDYVQSPAVASNTLLTVRLYEGAGLIGEWASISIVSPHPAFENEEIILDGAEFASIVNWSNLFVELEDSFTNIYRFPLGAPASGVAEPVKLHVRASNLTG